LVLDLRSSINYFPTHASLVSSPESSVSTDGRCDISRRPCIGVWPSRAKEFVPLSGTRPRFPRLYRPPASIFGGLRWLLVFSTGERPSSGDAWSSRSATGSSHPLFRLVPCQSYVVSFFFVFGLFCYSSVSLPHVYLCNYCVWVFCTFNTILTTFTGGPFFWHPCQKSIGSHHLALSPRTYFLRFSLLGCPVLYCCNLFLCWL
jgi:hypothetical protein